MAFYGSEKKKVLEASLWLSQHGFFGSLRGSGGNVSMKVSQSAMAITPSSVRYQDLASDEICIVGLDGKAIEVKKGFKPSIESGLHIAIYRNRPDVHAVVHTHQTYGSVFAILNMPIPPLFDEVSLALGASVEIIPYAISGSPELAANAASKLSNHANAYIIQNHGILALGQNLDQAVLHAELLEKVAQIYYLALSTGRPVSTLPAPITDLAQALKGARDRVGQAKR